MMQSPLQERTFAAHHGFIPIVDQVESTSIPAATIQVDTEVPKPQVQQQLQLDKTFWCIFGSLCFSEFIRAIDAVVLPVILPGIVHDLGASSAQGYMSGSSFLLCQTVFQPVYAGVAGVIGNKRCILMALMVFAGGSVLSGFAQNPYWMIGARALQGNGAGGMDVMCTMIFTEMIPLTQRGKYSGFLQLFGATGMVAGMIVAAVVETKISWRWVFFINPFLVIPPLIVLSIFLRNHRQKGGVWTHIKLVDWLGMLFVSLSFTSVIYALLAGGAVYPWSSVHVLVPLIIGSFGVVLFVIHQAFVIPRRISVDPLMPMRLFQGRTSATAYTITLLHSVVLAAVLQFFFIYVHVSSSLSILKSSLTMLPTLGLLFTSAAVTGVMTSRMKRYRIFNIYGGLLMTAGIATFIQLRENASRVEQLLLQVTPAIGAGMIFPARFLATQAAQNERDIPKAAATMAFVFNLGQCFALPIGATTYQPVWDRLVRRDVESGIILTQFIITSHDAEASGELIQHWPKAVGKVYRHIMAAAIAKIWIVLTVLAGVVSILALVMKETPLCDLVYVDELSERKAGDEADDMVRLIDRQAGGLVLHSTQVGGFVSTFQEHHLEHPVNAEG